MKKYILTIIAGLFLSSAFSQQIATYSQFMHDHYLINPAAAGTQDYIPISLGYKKLWTGFEGSPSFQSLGGNMKIMDNMGVGVRIHNYSAGFETKTGIDLTYAYQIDLGNDMKLSFGLSGVLTQFYMNKSEINLENPDDNTVLYASEKLITPDANFGTYFYGKNYFAGIAVFQLFGRQVNMMNTDNLENKQVRHYSLHGGYRFDINEDYSVEPSLVFRMIEAGQMTLDFNVKGTIMNIAWVGVSYRLNDAIVPMFGIDMDQFLFGYAYDITTSDIKNYSQGSHELMFIYKIGSSKTSSSL